jgi:PAS domain S-box-containing protein
VSASQATYPAPAPAASTARLAADARLADELHRLLVSSVVDYAIYGLTPDGRVVTWNAGAEQLKGYTAAEILGRSVSEFYPPEARSVDGMAARAFELLAEAALSGRAEDEGWRVRRDGTRFWANVIVTPVRDEHGLLLGFAKVTRDLTARRAAEEYARELVAEQAARAEAERSEAEMRVLNERLREQAAELEAQAIELEAQTEEAQSLMEELEQANEQLQETAAEAEQARDAAEAAQRVAVEAHARYRRLFEASPLPSWTVDIEMLRVVDVNEAAVARYGYSREEFRGLRLDTLRDAASLARLHADVKQISDLGRLTTFVQHRTKQGERLDIELNARAIVHDGRAAFVAVMTDVTERLRAEVRQRFLVEASALLAESLDYEVTLARIVKLAVPTLADWAAYNTLDGDHVRIAAIHHPDPAMERLAHEIDSRYPTRADVGAGVSKVIATGVPELIEEIPDEVLRIVAHDENHYAQLKSIGFRSLINVPLVARGRVLGALGFATGESGRRFTPEDLAFAEELARRAGLALDNALHFRAEQEARAQAEIGIERLRRLQRLAAAVSSSVDLETVSRLIVREVRAAVNADAAYIARRVPDDDELELVYGEGLPYEMEGKRYRFSLDMPVPGAHVVRTGVPLWLALPEDRDARFEHLQDSPIARAFSSSATLPLLVNGAAVGSLAVYYTAPHDFALEDRAFLSALAEHGALALERVRLFEAERAARADAEAANRSKSQFLATMSHELRTPLNAIGGYAELLELGIHGSISPEQRGALTRIQRSQKHLLSLINEVLNYARLEAAAVQYDLREVRVAEVLASVESFVMPQVRAKGLTLSVEACDPELAVRADAEKLGQVLLNLLSNAVKFTASGGTIAITCHGMPDLVPSRSRHATSSGSTPDTAQGAAFLEIAVTDTGVGIPAEQLDRIFEPFVQIGRTLNSPGEGTGLGLAISRDLARGMGGELHVRSVLGEGSTFAVTLRRAGR